MRKIIIKNLDKEIEASPVISVFNNLAMNGIGIFNKCGGKGICGKCRIKVLNPEERGIRKPNETEKRHLSEEELKQGFRLSCQLFAACDIELEVYLPKKKSLKEKKDE
jgi:Na+-transporting NADH:ubiquinone oxidoreductase subunit NqrF